MLDDVRAFLAAPRCGVLSTVGADGSPHQVVLHYWLQSVAGGDQLCVNGRADRVWCRRLQHDPRVSLLVHDADDPQHWVGVSGKARLVRTGAAAVEDAVSLAQRYGEDGSAYLDQERVTFVIVAERVQQYGAK